MKITFPNLTAKQIVEACNNKLGKGKLLYNTSWYEKEDFYTKEKCRPRTMEVSDEIEHFGKTWTECAITIGGSEMMNFAEMLYFIQEYYNKKGKYPDSRWSWTSSRSSDGGLVDVGDCGTDGVDVGSDYPGCSRSHLGVRFSRSVAIPEAEGGQPEASHCSLEKRVAQLELDMQKLKKFLII